MLVLSRRIGEQIVLPDQGVTVTLISVSGRRARLGITGPRQTAVHRGEVWNRIQSHETPAAGSHDDHATEAVSSHPQPIAAVGSRAVELQ